jgi:hypothetical protein
MRSGDPLTIVNSTISGNRATLVGGGIRSPFDSVVDIHVSTITDNHAATGGGIWKNGNGPVMLISSIVAGNEAVDGVDIWDALGAVVAHYSLIGENDGTSLDEAQTPDADGNLIGSAAGGGAIDPLLAVLANNGGPTKTHALLLGSPALDAVPMSFFAQPTPVHDYQLDNSLADALGGPDLVALGGTLTATSYEFGPNQGLNLSAGNFDPGDYSIEIVFTWSSLNGIWQKIIDFKNLTQDNGLYTFDDGLEFIVGPFAADQFSVGAARRLILTRDDTTDVVAAYINGNEVWNFVDVAGQAVFSGPSQIVRFFQDDTDTGQTEAGSGSIHSIRIFDHVLTADEVAAIDDPPPAAELPTRDQRLTPYLRVVDYDGIGGALVDIGAYESQGVPSFSPYDYNEDGRVNAADYTTWRNTKGQTGGVPFAGADGDGDGDITQLDYDLWKSHFGEGLIITPPGSGAVVAAATAPSQVDQLAQVASPKVSAASLGSFFAQPVEARGSSPGVRPQVRLFRATAFDHDAALLALLADLPASDRVIDYEPGPPAAGADESESDEESAAAWHDVLDAAFGAVLA